ASVIGLGVGIGIGTVGAAALASFSGGLKVASVGVPLIAVLASFAVGLGVTLLAALIPAFRASQVPPVAALREAAVSDRSLTRVTVAGTVLLVGGGGLLGYGLSGKAHGNTLWVVLIGVLVTFIAVALLTPLLGRPIVSVL